MIVTEYGACLNTSACAKEIETIADVSESLVVGWAYWQFKTYKDFTSQTLDMPSGYYNPDGSVQEEKIYALSRTYV